MQHRTTYFISVRAVALLLALVAFLRAGLSQETLKNADILKMAKLGFPSSTIISKIQATSTHFDVSIDTLSALTKHGVGLDVINEMILAKTREQKGTESAKDISDPKTTRKMGIYLYDSTMPATERFSQLDVTMVFATHKGSGFKTAMKQNFTMGLAKSEEIKSLQGLKSRQQIKSPSPLFYFYSDQVFKSSPNEFALVRLTCSKDTREVVVSKSNQYASVTGISDNDKQSFSYKEVSDGVFMLYVTKPLPPGEYGFIYTGFSPILMNRAFDFGIAAKN